MKELLEKRKVIADQIATIEADKKDGKWTEEQRSQIDDLLTQSEKLENEIELEERMAKQKAAAAAASSQRSTEKEKTEVKERFSITSFLREARDGNLTGINAEMHQEAVKEARSLGTSIQNHGLPSMIVGNEQRDSVAGTDTAGGHAIAKEKMSIIQYLEDNLAVRGMGADYMTGLVGDVSFPREDNSLTATWKAENASADELSPTLEEITLSPNRLTGFVNVSNQLIAQTSPSIDQRIIARLGGALARGIDKAAIQGTGSSNQPTGVLNTAGIGSVAIDTNGGAITWAKVVELIREVEVDNALIGSLGFLTNPLVRAAMQTIEKASGTAQFLLNNANDNLAGYNLGVSNHVPSDLTKGSSSGVCSALLFGNFNDLMIGQWGGLDIMVDPYTESKSAKSVIIANAYVDVAVAHPQSFAAIKDITIA